MRNLKLTYLSSVRGRTIQCLPARCADQDVTTLDSLPLELEILPTDDKAGTQLMVLAHTAKRLKNLEIQTFYSRVPTIFSNKK